MTHPSLQGPPFRPGDLVVTRAGYFGIVMLGDEGDPRVLVMVGTGTVATYRPKDVSAVLLPGGEGRQSFPSMAYLFAAFTPDKEIVSAALEWAVRKRGKGK